MVPLLAERFAKVNEQELLDMDNTTPKIPCCLSNKTIIPFALVYELIYDLISWYM